MKKIKSAITGCSGFVGSHLAELLIEKGHEVHGISRFFDTNDNLDQVKDKIKIHNIDLLEADKLYGLIYQIRPDYIFHLAGQSFVPVSWKSPVDTLQANVIGSANLFEAIRKAEVDCTIQIAGSSEEYGLVKKEECPINEDQPLRPLSPYAVSKISMDYLAYQYFKSYGMKIIRTRAFNHEGPRRGESFVMSNFAKQIAQAEKGLTKVIKHGDLSSVRDFTDVRDMVKAYLLAVEKCEPGEVYNIGTGEGISIYEMVLKFENYLKKDLDIKWEPDPSRMRPSDVPLLVCDSTKFREKTGWKPEITLGQTIKDTLNYWRERT